MRNPVVRHWWSNEITLIFVKDGSCLHEFRINEAVDISFNKFLDPPINSIAEIQLKKGLHTITIHNVEIGQMNCGFIFLN